MTLLPILAMAALQSISVASADAPTPLMIAPQTSPALNPLATQFDITSKATGRTYRIFVAQPSGPAPAKGWPVIYVLDGDIAFATVAVQNMLRSAYGESGALIVGIGYPDPKAGLLLRNRDLTPSEPNAVGKTIGLLGEPKPGDYGGGAGFRRFMTTELKDVIAASYRVDTKAQTLMGYSYSGLFTLGMLFQEPSAYQTYVIGSPSVWWNDREVLSGERAFTQRVRSGELTPRILVTSGGLEQDPRFVTLSAAAVARAATIDAMAKERMVDNARELAARLKAIPGKAGYRVEYVLFPGETHLSGIPSAVSRGYAFAMRP